ncbi:MAG: hypothetical protein JZD41_02275 [Thermoproteus sp.]|nr:hypothetical protein [Thermoproteus sp.]
MSIKTPEISNMPVDAVLEFDYNIDVPRTLFFADVQYRCPNGNYYVRTYPIPLRGGSGHATVKIKPVDGSNGAQCKMDLTTLYNIIGNKIADVTPTRYTIRDYIQIELPKGNYTSDSYVTGTSAQLYNYTTAPVYNTAYLPSDTEIMSFVLSRTDGGFDYITDAISKTGSIARYTQDLVTTGYPDLTLLLPYTWSYDQFLHLFHDTVPYVERPQSYQILYSYALDYASIQPIIYSTSSESILEFNWISAVESAFAWIWNNILNKQILPEYHVYDLLIDIASVVIPELLAARLPLLFARFIPAATRYASLLANLSKAIGAGAVAAVALSTDYAVRKKVTVGDLIDAGLIAMTPFVGLRKILGATAIAVGLNSFFALDKISVSDFISDIEKAISNAKDMFMYQRAKAICENPEQSLLSPGECAFLTQLNEPKCVIDSVTDNFGYLTVVIRNGGTEAGMCAIRGYDEANNLIFSSGDILTNVGEKQTLNIQYGFTSQVKVIAYTNGSPSDARVVYTTGTRMAIFGMFAVLIAVAVVSGIAVMLRRK